MTSTSTLCVVDPELKSAMVGDTYVLKVYVLLVLIIIVTYKFDNAVFSLFATRNFGIGGN